MGIGVSYTGANGKRKDFNVGSVDALQSAMGRVSPQRSMRGVEGVMPLQHSQAAGQGTRAKGGSAIVKDFKGELCLRGEESDTLVEGVKIYGSCNGRKGYFTIAEMDPPIQGKMCGKWLNVETKPEAGSMDVNAVSGPWSIPISRMSCELTSDSKLRVFNFFRELKFSADGRVIGVTEESVALVGEFKCGSGGGSGDYCVAPEFDGDGNLVKLTFGSGESLKKASVDPLSENRTVYAYVGNPYVN